LNQAWVDHVNFSAYVPAEITDFRVKYNGSTKRNTDISNREDYTAVAVFDNGKELNVSNEIVITGSKTVLKPDISRTVTVTYDRGMSHATKDVTVKCSTKYKELRVTYSGSKSKDTKINNKDDLKVYAVYSTPGEPDEKVDVTDTAILQNQGTLKAGGSVSIRVKYKGKIGTCKVVCADKAPKKTTSTATGYTNKHSSGSTTYVLNTSTGKFHRPDCYHIRQMSDRNRLDIQGTRDEVRAMGYTPCKDCNP